MKNRKSDLIVEVHGNKLKQESLNPDEQAKRKRSKWIKWLLNIIDNIVTALS